MTSHVTYTWTQGHKSLGLPIRALAKQLGRTRPQRDGDGRDKGKGRKADDKTMAIQEDQDGDIWSTI
jgi:hypothetical protein